MVDHKIKCPNCQSEHVHTSNLTKPNAQQSSIHGYTWETPSIPCTCGKVIKVQVTVKVDVYLT
jgi:hypothetical protein